MKRATLKDIQQTSTIDTNNMTVEQIGKSLRIPIGTAKSMLSRTRRKIKQSLKI